MHGNKMRWYDLTAYIVLIIGAINLGLSAFDFNLLEKIIRVFFPSYTITFAYIKTIIYSLIGLAGLYGIYLGFKISKE